MPPVVLASLMWESPVVIGAVSLRSSHPFAARKPGDQAGHAGNDGGPGHPGPPRRLPSGTVRPRCGLRRDYRRVYTRTPSDRLRLSASSSVPSKTARYSPLLYARALARKVPFQPVSGEVTNFQVLEPRLRK